MLPYYLYYSLFLGQYVCMCVCTYVVCLFNFFWYWSIGGMQRYVGFRYRTLVRHFRLYTLLSAHHHQRSRRLSPIVTIFFTMFSVLYFHLCDFVSITGNVYFLNPLLCVLLIRLCISHLDHALRVFCLLVCLFCLINAYRG